MDRRWGGGVLLFLAVLALVVIPRVISPPSAGGTASAEAPPGPVVDGDCIREVIEGYRPVGSKSRGVVSVVPCDTAHRTEVFEVTEGPTPRGTGQRDSALARCLNRMYLDDDPPGEWRPLVSLAVGVLLPSDRQEAAGQSWHACVVTAEVDLTSRLQGTTGTTAPAATGRCGFDVGTTSSDVPCDTPHTGEDFAGQHLPAGSTATHDLLKRGCAELIAAATARPGIVDERDVVIDVSVVAWGANGEVGDATLPLPADAAGGRAICSARTSDPTRTLTASLRQFGASAPLPLNS